MRFGPSPYRAGDPVVLVDQLGALWRDGRGRPQRGLVVRVTILGELVVQLERTGREVTVMRSLVKRCPQLAYVRPSDCGGAA